MPRLSSLFNRNEFYFVLAFFPFSPSIVQYPDAFPWALGPSHCLLIIISCTFLPVGVGVQGAMQLLNRQIAVVNFEPLRAHFLAVYTGVQAALPGLSAMPSMRSCLQRNASEKNPEKVCPSMVIDMFVN